MLLLPRKIILATGAVVEVAMHKGPVSSHDLDHRLQLPRRYLEPILQALTRKGILVGRHGKRGGYRLAKAQQAISVYDIFEAVKTLETGKSKIELPWWPPTLAQAEQCFASALERITVEDLVRAAVSVS